MGTLRKRIKYAIPLLSEQALNLSWVENRLLQPRYQAYLKQYWDCKPPLCDTDQHILEQLTENGIYVTTLEKLAFPGQAMLLEIGKQLFQVLEASGKSSQVKFQVTPNFSLLKDKKEVFQWGLNSRLLKIAENYIGLPIAYDTCLCNLSINNGIETATRRWHLDNEDRRVLKVIIYLSPVTDEGGPFQSINPEHSRQLLATVGNRCAFLSSQQAKSINQTVMNYLQSVTGPVGTVIFVDTAKIYHRGKPPTATPRRAITFGYCSRRPLRPFRCGRHHLDRSQLAQLVVGLSQKQQSCVFWRDELPAWIRQIPPYSYG